MKKLLPTMIKHWQSDPNDANALNNKGLALDDLGKHQEAITYYDKVLAIDPK